MRRVFSFIGTALLLGCAILTIKGQDLLPGKRTFSILGSQRPSILSSPESSELTVSSPATTVGVSSITMDTSILPLSPTPQERAGNELAEFLENKKCFTYSHDRWLKMRKTLENGRTPGEDDVGITTASKPAPPSAARPSPARRSQGRGSPGVTSRAATRR